MDAAPHDLLPFVKMHGCQNDYVVVTADDVADRDLPSLAHAVCARRTGVGADGLLVVGPSTRADVRMRMFNPNGSEAEMCGNGLRCAARYAWDFELVPASQSDVLQMETGAGVLTATCIDESAVRVSMGVPSLSRESIPMRGPDGPAIEEEIHVGAHSLRVTAVSMGNPHVVAFVEEGVAGFPLHDVGPQMERHECFPKRTNFEVAQVVAPGRIAQRTWERGVGETRACGTGACAVAVAGKITGRTGSDVSIDLPGGTLEVSWKGQGHEVHLAGPTQVVFAGAWSAA